MAVGDVVTNITSLANNAYLTYQPAAGVETMVINTYGEGAFETYVYNGTTRILIDKSTSTPYATTLQKILVNNTIYMQIKNVSGSTLNFGYSGIQIK